MSEPENHAEVIPPLERGWEVPGGFLYRIRAGDFDHEAATKYLRTIRSVRLHPDDPVPRRLVALLWFLPVFLEWNRERVIEKGGNSGMYDRFRDDIIQELTGLLGAP